MQAVLALMTVYWQKIQQPKSGSTYFNWTANPYFAVVTAAGISTIHT
ncbi:MAG: hypothetical protein FWH01_00765 [Oscillospiraceae bacterium]|nr:hypothetical protein [Oscillospiraceae bacterium]